MPNPCGLCGEEIEPEESYGPSTSQPVLVDNVTIRVCTDCIGQIDAIPTPDFKERTCAGSVVIRFWILVFLFTAMVGGSLALVVLKRCNIYFPTCTPPAAPTPFPSRIPTPTPTPTPSKVPTRTPVPSNTSTPTPTPSMAFTPSTITPRPSATPYCSYPDREKKYPTECTLGAILLSVLFFVVLLVAPLIYWTGRSSTITMKRRGAAFAIRRAMGPPWHVNRPAPSATDPPPAPVPHLTPQPQQQRQQYQQPVGYPPPYFYPPQQFQMQPPVHYGFVHVQGVPQAMAYPSAPQVRQNTTTDFRMGQGQLGSQGSFPNPQRREAASPVASPVASRTSSRASSPSLNSSLGQDTASSS